MLLNEAKVMPEGMNETVRGYKRSGRPRELDEPAGAHEPIVRTPEAAGDAGSTADYILRERHIEKLNLIGRSWGNYGHVYGGS